MGRGSFETQSILQHDVTNDHIAEYKDMLKRTF